MAHNAEWGDGIMIEAASAFYQRLVIIVPSAAHAREESMQHTIRMGVQSDKTPSRLDIAVLVNNLIAALLTTTT